MSNIPTSAELSFYGPSGLTDEEVLNLVDKAGARPAVVYYAPAPIETRIYREPVDVLGLLYDVVLAGGSDMRVLVEEETPLEIGLDLDGVTVYDVVWEWSLDSYGRRKDDA